MDTEDADSRSFPRAEEGPLHEMMHCVDIGVILQ